jgi:hypothetical protein
MEWVASTLTLPRGVVYPALLPLMRTTRLPAVDWTEAPADLNGLVRFGERLNLVSARVPSLFKRTLHTVCVCVCIARVIQHAMRMRRITMCGLPGFLYFYTLPHKRHDFRGKKKLLNTKCVFSFPLQLLPEPFLILRRNERGMIKKYTLSLHVKQPLLLSNFSETWIFSTVFREVLKYQILWESVQREPSYSMRRDGRTWSYSRFSKFCERT